MWHRFETGATPLPTLSFGKDGAPPRISQYRYANPRLSMTHRRVIARMGPCRHTLLSGVVAAFLAGCHPRPEAFPLDPVPMREAVRIVNQNIAKVTGTLKASGFVDGYFTLPDGRSRSYHLDGTLFYLAPRHLRFDLKSFGDRKFLFGSNREHFWYYDKEADGYDCARHGRNDELTSQIPIPPDQLIDALGLTLIRTESATSNQTQRVQRVVDDYQQILFLVGDEQDNLAVRKEYWLDRYRPRLVRCVVFRDADGVVEMESKLDDYKPLTAGGPWLPHTMTASWPRTDARMRFRVTKWRQAQGVGPKSVQFTAPKECPE